ncbi:DUF551 domain-containing protein [Rahnella inusitata]|uniref:DUF551 domain-containing protein n=1 Tax=Rahnella inusitata TaxID=58169 RepID=UPI0039BDC2AD
MNNDLELHMGEAMHVFDALKDECLDSNVFDAHLGAMGAYRVEKWSTKIGVLLEYTEANGGCSLKITTPQPAHTEGNSPVIPDGWKLVPIKPTEKMCDVKHVGIDVFDNQAEDGECYSIGGKYAAKVYLAMLAAAPNPDGVLISEGTKSNGWINCRDRMPEKDGMYQCWGKFFAGDDYGYFCSWYRSHIKPLWVPVEDDCDPWDVSVTHWMLLPDDPKPEAE